MKITGKVAVITGASRGIGKATAIELAQRGAFVIVNYRGSEAAALETVAEIKSAGGDAASCLNCPHASSARRIAAGYAPSVAQT